MPCQVDTLLRVHHSRVVDVRRVFVHQSLVYLQLGFLVGDVCGAKFYLLYLLILLDIIIRTMSYYRIQTFVQFIVVSVQTESLF